MTIMKKYIHLFLITAFCLGMSFCEITEDGDISGKSCKDDCQDAYIECSDKCDGLGDIEENNCIIDCASERISCNNDCES